MLGVASPTRKARKGRTELAAPLRVMMPGEMPAAEIQTSDLKRLLGNWVLGLAFLGLFHGSLLPCPLVPVAASVAHSNNEHYHQQNHQAGRLLQ